MKIQNNINSTPSFGMNVKINANTAYHNGRALISRDEIKLIQQRAKGIAGETDVLDLLIGSVTRIVNADKKDFRESYTMIGNSVISGNNARVNLTQSWLKSQADTMMRSPSEVIHAYLDTVVENLKRVKFKK